MCVRLPFLCAPSASHAMTGESMPLKIFVCQCSMAQCHMTTFKLLPVSPHYTLE